MTEWCLASPFLTFFMFLAACGCVNTLFRSLGGRGCWKQCVGCLCAEAEKQSENKDDDVEEDE